jgi:uncharacterized protein
MRFLLIAAVKFYRAAISPIFPPSCRFDPTCSEYAVAAITIHGAFWGVAMSAWRILHCHPFCKGGFDPVPANVKDWKKNMRKPF